MYFMDYDSIEGKGDFIFFLHGFGGSKESFKIVKNYLDNNMVFVSFAGFGESEIKQPYFVKDYARDLTELIINLAKGKSVILVCHSFGARVASYVASEHKELVKKLMIVDGAGIKPRRTLGYYLKVFKYKQMKKRVQKGKAPESALEKFGSSDYKSLSKIMKQTFVNVVNEDLKPKFRQIECPTLLFYGENDKETPLYMARKLHRLIKDSALIKVKGAGHFSYLDNFGLFLSVLKAFI